MGSEPVVPVAHPNHGVTNVNASLVYIDDGVQSAPRRDRRELDAIIERRHPAGYVFGIAASAL